MIVNRFPELLEEKRRRDLKDWSLYDVHRATGIWRSTLKTWATGESEFYSGDAIIKLCQFLECDIAELLVFVREDEPGGSR